MLDSEPGEELKRGGLVDPACTGCCGVVMPRKVRPLGPRTEGGFSEGGMTEGSMTEGRWPGGHGPEGEPSLAGCWTDGSVDDDVSRMSMSNVSSSLDGLDPDCCVNDATSLPRWGLEN